MHATPGTDITATLERFVDSQTPRNTLGLVYGRRRIGKSTMLSALTHARSGFYWEATRAETPLHLARLGAALGAHLGVGPLALASWEDALIRLLQLGAAGNVPIVLDEFGYLIAAEPGLDSTLSALLGPSRRGDDSRARLILCGSAMAMMRKLSDGQAPLRGRAAIEAMMHAHDYRQAATWLGDDPDLMLAARLFAVIGGVVGYATDMVDDDLPTSLADFPRWVSERVLSPAATLHHEATTLLAEDPTFAASNQSLYHSVLSVIANGSVTAGTIASALKRNVPGIAPVLNRLVDAGFVIRHDDPIRARRPLYALGDSFLQFHYAALEPHGTILRGRDPIVAWERRIAADFDSRVRGPVFEEQARTWVRRFATEETLGGEATFIGPSATTIAGIEYQIDVVAAAGHAGSEPGDRTVLAIGEAKAGETVGSAHLRTLEHKRSALGSKAAEARLLLFATAFTPDLERLAERRNDIQLIGLERLYRAG